MHYTLSIALHAALVGVSRAQAPCFDKWSVFGINNNQWNEVVERDVCIIGGGSSGVNAAVTLKDLNKTVAVIDTKDRLGGHTETYLDPKTGEPVDIGVVIFPNTTVVTDYFAKFNIPLLNTSLVVPNKPGQPANKSLPAFFYETIPKYVDFRNESPTTAVSFPDAETLERAIGVLAQYPYLLTGYDLPDPVPSDLYLPFGEFLDKYNITGIASLYFLFSQGMGDLYNIPTIYAIKYYNLGDLATLTSGYLIAANGNTSELYWRAGEYLGASNVFLQSSVLATKRTNTTDGRLELLVSARAEGVKLFQCDQILYTAPPTLSNFAAWDLSVEERAVFSQFVNANGYWTGLVTNVGLDQTTSWTNGANGTAHNVPVLPGLYALGPVGVINDVWTTKFGAQSPTLDDGAVKAIITSEIQTLQKSNNVPVTDPEFLAFSSHTPFMLQVSPDSIENGFFRDLAGLQGGFGGKMYYSGAAFHTQYSALLWRFNEEVVIPMMTQ